MRFLIWLARAFYIFVVFAFALNNQHEAAVRWFFGYEWHAPMVIIVLVAFTGGAAFGVLAMVPSWWRHRRIAKRNVPSEAVALPTPSLQAPTPPDFAPEHPPRDGL